MNKTEFETEMLRLMTTWPKTYNVERTRIFFDEVRHLSAYDFRDAVSNMIAECRAAPLLPELREAISRIQEIKRNKEKILRAKDSEAFWETKNKPEEAKLIIGTIKAYLEGKMPEDQWQNFKKEIKEWADSADRN